MRAGRIARVRRTRLWVAVAATVVALAVGGDASAQPSGPPHRFSGSASIDGEPAAAGTSVTAVVNGTECGSATVITNAAGSTYSLDVPDSCADAGDAVFFRVGGYDAAESGEWSASGRTDLDLTVSTTLSNDRTCPDGWEWNRQSNECAPQEPVEEPSEPEEPGEPVVANVEVTVWRSVSNPSLLYLSTRPEGGSWTTQNTALDMSALSRSGRFHQSNATAVAVSLAGGGTANVEVTVWRSVSNPSLLYLSTRPEGGSWDTQDAALDMSALSRSGRFHQSDAVVVEVPLPDAPAPEEPAEDRPPSNTTPADRSQCRIDEAMAARVIASTVKVETTTGSGSAFYIGNGEFITAAHVVDDNPRTITLHNERINVSARIVGYTSQDDGDIAILSASAPRMMALEWTGAIGEGAEVAVVGYPLGQGLRASISRGIVSRAFTDGAGISQIQTDAPANAGNSGGPLVDACGRVAGVVSWKIVRDSQGNATEGLAFAVSDPTLAARLAAIRSGRYVAPVGESFLTISAFCTELPTEDIDAAECHSRSSSLNLSGGRVWSVWARGVESWDAVVYRFNDGAELRQSGVQAALRALGAGCHELEIAERGISTHWSVPYEFCFATVVAGPTWAQMDSLKSRIGELWGSTIETRDGLWDQWNTIVNSERIPSSRLSGVALDLADLSLAQAEAIGDFAGHPALANQTMADWWLAAWGVWLGVAETDLEYGRYARGESTWGDILWKQAASATAFADYKSAECAVWRLLYSNPEVVCDQVADAERDAVDAEAEARAWTPPAVVTPDPLFTVDEVIGVIGNHVPPSSQSGLSIRECGTRGFESSQTWYTDSYGRHYPFGYRYSYNSPVWQVRWYNRGLLPEMIVSFNEITGSVIIISHPAWAKC